MPRPLTTAARVMMKANAGKSSSRVNLARHVLLLNRKPALLRPAISVYRFSCDSRSRVEMSQGPTCLVFWQEFTIIATDLGFDDFIKLLVHGE
jgi:hypothetical protein